jgi:hypothetical protein
MTSTTLNVNLLVATIVGPMIACAPADRPSATSTALSSGDQAGKEFRHRINGSQFALGSDVVSLAEGGFDKIIGSEGVFATWTANGATFAVPNADAAALSVPALSTDEKVHNARVLAYFTGLGLPSEEVVGMHVTTKMAGQARKGERILPTNTHFVNYATHLERGVGGIPVVGSQAWAVFNAKDHVVSEGVFWPAIPASVVAEAKLLAAAVNDPVKHAKLRDDIRASKPDLGDIPGRAIITHTANTYPGTVVATAAYEIITPGLGGHIEYFDLGGTPLRLPDDAGNKIDSSSVK